MGAHARSLKNVVLRLQKRYPAVAVRHIDHPNPAAQGDIFCDGDHFALVNDALRGLGADDIDWLPSKGWNSGRVGGPEAGTAGRMGEFIASTMELHKLYLERLASVKDEGLALPAITGVFDTPLMDFPQALAPVTKVLSGLDWQVQRSHEFGLQQADDRPDVLSAAEAAALHLYTCESAFYRQINATLRNPDRGRIAPYLPYLRLLFSAVSRLPVRTEPLWRGVALDLRAQYPVGRTVTWWGVSSCTSKLGVAQGFMGGRGRRTLFEVTPVRAVGIRRFSAFSGEEEFILAPGTQLAVTDVRAERNGLCTVRLTELTEQNMVA
ncbi:ADP-ribosyltransferase domain-containing protein [Micromonospora zhanjiangensis]